MDRTHAREERRRVAVSGKGCLPARSGGEEMNEPGGDARPAAITDHIRHPRLLFVPRYEGTSIAGGLEHDYDCGHVVYLAVHGSCRFTRPSAIPSSLNT
jgi:hypothetical protein